MAQQKKFDPYQNQIKTLKKKIAANKELLADEELAELAQDELKKLEKQLKTLKKASQNFQESLKPEDEDGSSTTRSSAIFEIRAGAGGDEAKIWADDLLRMYVRYCEAKKLKVQFIDDLVFQVSGKTKLTFERPASNNTKSDDTNNNNDQAIETVKQTIYPFELFKYETGVHRVQRVPVTETQGRIHTSTASIAVLPKIGKKAIEIKDEDLEWEFMRSSGAGGQSVNKTSSAVRLTHKPSGIVVVSRQERKQFQNREIALTLLRSQLWEREEEKRQQKIGNVRSAIGRNMRAEKIRTYNFPQNRVTDHRIKESWYSLEDILDGELDPVIIKTKQNLKNEATEDTQN